jgi:hypothetical protein
MFGSRSSYLSIKEVVFVFFLLGTFVCAQEKNGSSSGTILPKATPDYGLLIPDKTVEDYSFLDNPEKNNPSMTDKEEFINPGDRYLKKLQKDKPIPKGVYLGDTYLGDVHTFSSVAQIVCRDYEYEDGDRVRILVNDKEVVSNLALRNQFFVLKLPLVSGFNKLDFQALNQGSSGPNTAELRIFDLDGSPLAAHKWNLSTGATATLIIVKEGDTISPQ